MVDEQQIEWLTQLAVAIRTATEENSVSPDALRTSADLAREFRLKHDYVKKQLRFLREMGLILAVGMNPKRYRFDTYQYRQWQWEPPDDSLLLTVLGRMEAVMAQSASNNADNQNGWHQADWEKDWSADLPS